jgi:two-component system copper resistance phosphate regulon response regulator CusR
VQIADLEMNSITQRVCRAGRAIRLTAKGFALLSLLARHRRLRPKIDDPFQRKLIHTGSGRGHVLEER